MRRSSVQSRLEAPVSASRPAAFAGPTHHDDARRDDARAGASASPTQPSEHPAPGRQRLTGREPAIAVRFSVLRAWFVTAAALLDRNRHWDHSSVTDRCLVIHIWRSLRLRCLSRKLTLRLCPVSASCMSTQKCIGTCHCGRVRYEVDIDLGAAGVKQALRSDARTALIRSSAFRLLAGGADLDDNQFTTVVGANQACRFCGIRTFGKGRMKALGGDFYAVNLATLDLLSGQSVEDARSTSSRHH